MSRSIDERAVIMEFDNKQFESGIAQSRKSLEQFEKALKLEGASDAINKIQKQFANVDFSAIQRSLESIQGRFSTFGVASMAVIQNLTNEVVNFTKGALTNLYNKINEGGKKRALSLEKSRFLLQGILKDETRVADAMKQASDSVDGTAYSLDAAAKAAATFVATGLEGQDLRNSLDAVANLTATVSGNYEDISNIITKIVGSHKLYRTELNSIVSRGFALDKYIAEYIENVNKGVWETTDAVRQNIKDMDLLGKKAVNVSDLTSGKNSQLKAISSDLVMEVLNKKLEGQAKRANETFTGILDNIGAAWSRIGAMFWEPLVAQNSELVLLLQAIRLHINNVKKGLEPFAKMFTNIILNISKAAQAMAWFETETDEEGNSVTSASKALIYMSDVFESFYKIFKPVLNLMNEGIKIFGELFGREIVRRINDVITAFSTWVDRGADGFKTTRELIERGKSLEDRIRRLAIAFDKATKPIRDFFQMVRLAFYQVFDLSNQKNDLDNLIDKLTEFFNKISGNYDSKKAVFPEMVRIFESLKKIGTSVWRIVSAIGSAFSDIFIIEGADNTKGFLSWLADILEKIADMIVIDDETFKSLKETFKNIFIVARTLVGVFGAIINALAEALPALAPFITELVKAVALVIEWLAKNIDAEKAGEDFANALKWIGEKAKDVAGFIGGIIEKVKEFIGHLIEAGEESGFFEFVKDTAKEAFDAIKKGVEGAPEKIKEFFDSIGVKAPTWDDFTNWLKDVTDWLKKAKDAFANFKIGDGFQGFIDLIKQLFSGGEDEELSPTKSKLGAVGGGKFLGKMAPVAKEMAGFGNLPDVTKPVEKFAGIVDTVKKYLLPAIYAIGDIVVAIVALKALSGFMKFHKLFKQFMDINSTIASGIQSWASFPGQMKDMMKSEMSKQFVTQLLAVIGLLILCITGMLLAVNEIVKSGKAKETFLAAGIIFGVIVVAIVGLLIYMSVLINKIEKSKSLSMSKVAPLLTGIAAIFAAIGVMFLLIGATLMMIATALTMVPNNTDWLFGIFITIILAVGLLIGEMGFIQSKVNSTAGIFKWWGPTLLALGALFEAMGHTLIMCAAAYKIDPEGKAIGAMFGLFVIVGVLLAAIAYITKTDAGNEKAILSVGGVLAALALVMVAYATSLAIVVGAFSAMAAVISQLDSDKVGEAFKYFIGLSAILVVGIGLLGMLLVAMNKLSNGTLDYKSFIGIAVALMAFAGAMKILVSAFVPLVALLSSPAADAAWEALQMFGYIAAGLVGGLAILGLISAIGPQVSFGFLAMGVALLSFSTSMLIASLAFNLFITGLGRLLAILTMFANANPEEIGKGLVNFFTGLAIGLKNSEGPIKDGINSLFGEGGIMDALWDGLASSAERKAERFGQAFVKIIDAIHKAVVENKDKLSDIMGVIADVFREFMDNISGFNIADYLVKLLLGEDSDFSLKAEGLLGLLTEILARIATSIPETIWKIMQGIGKIIEENIDSIRQFIMNRIDDFDVIFQRLMVSLGKAIENASGPIIEALFYVLGLTVSETAKFFEEHHDDILSILGALMLLPLEALSNFLVENGELILTTLGGITVILLKWLGILFKELRKWWDEHWTPDVEPFLYNSFMDTLRLAAKALRDSTRLITETAVALGFDIIAGLIDGIADGMPEIANSAIELIETFRDEVCTPDKVERVIEAGAGIVKNFVDGISNWLNKPANIVSLRNSFIGLGRAAINAIRTFFGLPENSGNSTSESGGIFKMVKDFATGFGDIIKNAWQWMKSGFDELGKQISQWWDNLWKDQKTPDITTDQNREPKVQLQSVNVDPSAAGEAAESLTEAINMAVDESLDIDPVITPVVDMSNVESAAEMVSRLFGGYGGIGGFSMTTGSASRISAELAAANTNSAIAANAANGSVVNFTQNNYSPESLSHYEIYRQTKNLLHTIDARTN